MRHEIVLAPQAADDLRRLKANVRSAVRQAIDLMSRQRKTPVKAVTLSDARAGLSKYLKAAEREEVVITRNGRPAGALIGITDEDDWFDYRLSGDPRFLKRVADARSELKAGRGVRIEDV